MEYNCIENVHKKDYRLKLFKLKVWYAMLKPTDLVKIELTVQANLILFKNL